MSKQEAIFVIVTVFLAVWGHTTIKADYQKVAQLRTELSQIEEKIADVQEKNDHDERSIKKLNEGDSDTEIRVLREEFGHCSPDEIIFVFKNDTLERQTNGVSADSRARQTP